MRRRPAERHRPRLAPRPAAGSVSGACGGGGAAAGGATGGSLRPQALMASAMVTIRRVDAALRMMMDQAGGQVVMLSKLRMLHEVRARSVHLILPALAEGPDGLQPLDFSFQFSHSRFQGREASGLGGVLAFGIY
jgi:hypothetical protein